MKRLIVYAVAMLLNKRFPIYLLVLVLVLYGVPQTMADIMSVGPHDHWNSIPFWSAFGAGRYQQVFKSSMFPSDVNITSFSFSSLHTGTYQGNVQIRLALTTAAVGGLSTTLDNNVKGTLTPVFSNAAFSQLITGGSETFSLAFDFSGSPFFYDPTSGENLLFDVLISDQSFLGTAPWALSAELDSGFSSRAYNLNSTNADGIALRAKIGTRESVPEPGTLLLLSTGLVGLAGYGKFRNRRRKK